MNSAPAIAVITAAGIAIPRWRLSRRAIAAAISWVNPAAQSQSAGARAVGNWDEDTLTLAVEAAQGCVGGPPPTALHLASTTLPFADRSNAALVAAALDLPEAIETLDLGGSLRAGTTALANAARRGGAALVVASDVRKARPGSAQEFTIGHGAAALRIETAGTAAAPLASVLGTGHLAANFVDHYRSSGESFDYGLEERWIRDASLAVLPARAIEAALTAAGISAQRVHHFVMPGSAAVSQRIASSAGLSAAAMADALTSDCGDTGAAHPLLMLVASLERCQPGDVIVVVGVGQGVDALVLRAEAGLQDWTAAATTRTASRALASGREEPSYVRYLSNSGQLAVDFGMRAERDNRTAHSTAWRKHRMLDAFVGGRCGSCGAVQFPKSRVCVNPECRATDTQQDHPLAQGSGRVKTFTEDWQAYSARPPYIYGNVAFADGGNLLMEFTDLDSGELAVGDTVRFAFRIKDVDRQRGFKRYFWKAVKTAGAS